MQSNRTEAQLQKAVVDYIKLQYPNIRYCASLGGIYNKSKAQNRKVPATGYVAGVPDLQITEPNSKFHGLFIEIKLDKKCYPSQYQKDWIKDLNTRGYYAKVCKGFDECIDTIDIYLKH